MINMIDKIELNRKFSKACRTYDDASCIQKQVAKLLVEELMHTIALDVKDLSILDVGAGTGYTTKLLNQRMQQNCIGASLNSVKYTLNDISHNMLSAAKHQLKQSGIINLSFQAGDMEEIEFDYHDIIVSNFALQWASCLKSVIDKLYNSADILAFSCLLDGTFDEWYKLCAKFDSKTEGGNLNGIQYPKQKELADFVKRKKYSSFSYRVEEFEIPFDCIKSFLTYLSNIGASYNTYKLDLGDLRHLIKTMQFQPFSAKYKVFFAVLVK